MMLTPKLHNGFSNEILAPARPEKPQAYKVNLQGGVEMKRDYPFSLFAILVIASLTLLAPFPVVAGEGAKFDSQGALLLPEGYRSWMYVGTTVTPNDMNDGKAAFPEFHNVYIDPHSFSVYRNTGKFPDGTILVKETLSVGSKQASSGNGYFMGDFFGLFAEVKDSKRFPDEPENWAFFTFRESPDKPLMKKAKAHPTAACSNCHQLGAKERVFSQYYPILEVAKSEK
jgi:hypothetical protein